jgi:hypothetical protein
MARKVWQVYWKKHLPEDKMGGMDSRPTPQTALLPNQSLVSQGTFNVLNWPLSRSRVPPSKRPQEENEGSAGHGSLPGGEEYRPSEGTEGNHESSNSARSNGENEGAPEDGGDYDSDTNGNGKYLVGVT